MKLEPKDLYQKLEFDKVIELLEKLCLGDQGRAAVRALQPMTDREKLNVLLTEVRDFKLGIENHDTLPIGTYDEISEELRMLDIEGYVLAEDGLRKLNVLLLFVRDIFRFFNSGRRQSYPALYDVIREVDFKEDLLKEIEKVIDEDGNIKPDASPELKKIRRLTLSKQREMERQFRVLINEYRNKGWLSDNVESFRNGRRVLSVPSEHKRKIRGIIHDESATGRTAFIEPEGVIDINNDIFDLEQEERREIYRILRELSAVLRPFLPELQQYRALIIRFDIIQAKGRLAAQMQANMPELVDGPHFGLLEAYHPLLLLKNKQINKPTVPFDLTLFGKNRILVLSGPNAGGKSITMKATGLIQIMVQSGLLVPVQAESKMGLFQSIFADIGDQQSLEDDLSTYSSRLQNARRFIEKADKNTLVLIDEFGSGTDPKIGGAIAEGIMRELHHKGVYGIITTHYSNLKIFAFKTKGIVNASMHFNNDTLSPTYELKVGRPGSSYAFEIAQKSGLQDKVLQYARKRIGRNERAVDQMLVDLQREKKEVEEKLENLVSKQKTLERLMKNYNQLHKDLEVRRKRHKLDAKEQALQEQAQGNKELEKVIRDIREEQNLEKAKKMAMQAKAKREQLHQDVKELRQDIYYSDEKTKVSRAIQEGDFVKLRTGGATGEVEVLDRKNAIVLIGDMRMTVKIRDLELANEPLNIQSTKSVKSEVSRVADFQPKLDIRGMRYEESMRVVEEYVDQALMANAAQLRIVHGKGSGALRQAVHKKLREYKQSIRFHHPEAQQGGEGVTIVELG